MMKYLLMSISVIGLLGNEGLAALELWKMGLDGAQAGSERQSPVRNSPNSGDTSDTEEETDEKNVSLPRSLFILSEEETDWGGVSLPQPFPIFAQSLPLAIPGKLKLPKDPIDMAQSLSFILGSSPPLGGKSLSQLLKKQQTPCGSESAFTEKNNRKPSVGMTSPKVAGWKIEPPKK